VSSSSVFLLFKVEDSEAEGVFLTMKGAEKELLVVVDQEDGDRL
jgi:hypothetical protein